MGPRTLTSPDEPQTRGVHPAPQSHRFEVQRASKTTAFAVMAPFSFFLFVYKYVRIILRLGLVLSTSGKPRAVKAKESGGWVTRIGWQREGNLNSKRSLPTTTTTTKSAQTAAFVDCFSLWQRSGTTWPPAGKIAGARGGERNPVENYSASDRIRNERRKKNRKRCVDSA